MSFTRCRTMCATVFAALLCTAGGCQLLELPAELRATNQSLAEMQQQLAEVQLALVDVDKAASP
jgi:hypothetical protein